MDAVKSEAAWHGPEIKLKIKKRARWKQGITTSRYESITITLLQDLKVTTLTTRVDGLCWASSTHSSVGGMPLLVLPMKTCQAKKTCISNEPHELLLCCETVPRGCGRGVVVLVSLIHKIGSRNFRHFYLFPKIMLFAKHSDASVWAPHDSLVIISTGVLLPN